MLNDDKPQKRSKNPKGEAVHMLSAVRATLHRDRRKHTGMGEDLLAAQWWQGVEGAEQCRSQLSSTLLRASASQAPSSHCSPLAQLFTVSTLKTTKHCFAPVETLESFCGRNSEDPPPRIMSSA